MPITHDGDITIPIALDPAPVTLQGFGIGLIIVPEANNTLDGAKTRVYAGSQPITDAENDQSSGFISQLTLDKIRRYFGQGSLSGVPQQSKLIVGKRDAATPEPWSDTLADIQASNDEWYWFAIDSRDPTEIQTVSDLVESSYTKFFVAQTSDTDFKTSSPTSGTLPADLENNERTFVNWHTNDSVYQDIAIGASRGVFDLDRSSSPWFGPVAGVDDKDYSTITGGEVSTIKGNNGNVMLPFGKSFDKFVKDGVNMAGRAAYVILTRDWFKNRLQNDVATEIGQTAARGEKIPVSERGQAQMAKLVRSRFQQGEGTHFQRGSTRIVFPEILQSNRDNELIPLEGSAVIHIAGQRVNFKFEFTRS